MTGIICIFYNNPQFLLKQHEHLQRFCKCEYELIVVDNSTNTEASEAIKYHAERFKLEYLKTSARSVNGSESHAFAASIAYKKYRHNYAILFFVDHDCFAIKDFSPIRILASKKLAGLGQQKGNLTYYWPGCFMFRTSIEVDFSMIPGRDTGGATNKAIQLAKKENCVFFNEAYAQNPGFNKSQYDFYALIHNGTFMHFINGSNWAGSADNEERINSLFNELQRISNENGK